MFAVVAVVVVHHSSPSYAAGVGVVVELGALVVTSWTAVAGSHTLTVLTGALIKY